MDADPVFITDISLPELKFKRRGGSRTYNALQPAQLSYSSPLALCDPLSTILDLSNSSPDLVSALSDAYTATYLLSQPHNPNSPEALAHSSWGTIRSRVTALAKPSLLPPHLSSSRTRIAKLAAHAAAIHVRTAGER